MSSPITKNPFLRFLALPALLPRRWFLHARSRREKAQFQHDHRVLSLLEPLLVEDPVIRIEEFGGVFQMDARSDLFKRIILRGEYEPDLVALVKRFVDPARDALDVGGNAGFFSVLLAKLLSDERKILAFEPVPAMVRRFRRNMTRNEVKGVILFEGVASCNDNPVELKVIAGKEEYASMGDLAHFAVEGLKWETIAAPAITLDAAVQQHSLDPGFLKVDVEGAEQWVLEGADELLEKSRPIILLELNDPMLKKNGSSAQAILNLLKAKRYLCFDPERPHMPPGSISYGNVMAFPAESNVQAEDLTHG